MDDLISRELAMERIANDNVVGGMERINEYNNSTEFNEYLDGISDAITTIFCDVPSADAVQGWRTGKPKKQGEYTVTVKSMRGGMVESLYYGKPLMPNYKVKGMCWYRSDDEWGDVVYDDADILAWMPLPKPYKGGDTE